MTNRDFLSPVRKLAAFFQASRDRWKAKCQQAKYELKLLKRRFEKLRKNCDVWQQRLEEAQTQCQQLRMQREHLLAQNQKLQAQVEGVSKKGVLAS